ncbi:minor tail protein [Arthrobacter phage Atraxa]|uniref:Minor tail protein n=1 Tax=Arthrobacter phage Atraxa TaxID=2419947 RepID=A0A3G2KD68_9CAUD|nr:minor tail protein [Arthrobacter phage Atraxa]AYN56966.1 minor tail protein [Arthrobacter phage Atraxa]AYN59074.1 minor tail protein [Arthrobacter phage Sputnik]
MATFKPGRLRRVLTPIVGNAFLFALYTPAYGAYEDEIISITINRGVDGRNVGSNPTTAEVSLKGRRDGFETGKVMRVFLRDDPGAALSTYIYSTPGKIATRFDGRLGTVGIDDDGKRATTDIAGSSWIAQMNYSPASFTPVKGQTIAAILSNMVKANEPLRGIVFKTNIGPINILNWVTNERTLFRDGVGKFAADIGIILQERRNGETWAHTHVQRNVDSNNKAVSPYIYPLMRAQGIAPARYEQPNERPAKRVEFKIVNESGGQAVRTAEIANPGGELRETESVDWTQFQVTAVDNQLYREAYARVYESSSRLYRLPKITIDILHLLKDGSAYSRHILRQVLEMEVGEPVFLSGDWPNKLQGAHFAEGITEEINSEEWKITLSLVPHLVATGYPSPAFKPRAWDSVDYAWQDETREWNQA